MHDRQLADYWELITNTHSNSNSYSPNSYYDDSSCSSPSEDGDQACQDCDNSCIEPSGCGWFLKSTESKLCNDDRFGGFIKKMNLNSIFNGRRGNQTEKSSKEILRNLGDGLQKEKSTVLRKLDTSDSKVIREAYWHDRKITILSEISFLVKECRDDSEGLDKLCRLIDAAVFP